MRRFVIIGAAFAVFVGAAPASADAGWDPGTVVPTSGRFVQFRVGVAGSGAAIAVWVDSVDRGSRVWTAIAPRDRGFRAPFVIAHGAAGATQSFPDVDVNERGDVLVAWQEQSARGRYVIRAARASRLGRFGRAVTVSGRDIGLVPRVALNDAGAAAVVWRRGSRGVALAAARPASRFGRPAIVERRRAFSPHVDVDELGRRAAIWARSSGAVMVARSPADGGPTAVAAVGRAATAFQARSPEIAVGTGQVTYAWSEVGRRGAGPRGTTRVIMRAGSGTFAGAPRESLRAAARRRDDSFEVAHLSGHRSGRALVGWTNDSLVDPHGTGDVMVSERPTAGRFGLARRLYTGAATLRDVAVGAGGSAVVLWSEMPDRHRTDLPTQRRYRVIARAATRNRSGPFGAPTTIGPETDGGTFNQGFSLDMAESGFGMAIWDARPDPTAPPADVLRSARYRPQ